jgi:hypothetical protein
MEMRRQTEPTDVELDLDGEESGVDDDVDEVRSSTSGDSAEGAYKLYPWLSRFVLVSDRRMRRGGLLGLMKGGNSGKTSKLNRGADIESRRLSFEI